MQIFLINKTQFLIADLNILAFLLFKISNVNVGFFNWVLI